MIIFVGCEKKQGKCCVYGELRWNAEVPSLLLSETANVEGKGDAEGEGVEGNSFQMAKESWQDHGTPMVFPQPSTTEVAAEEATGKTHLLSAVADNEAHAKAVDESQMQVSGADDQGGLSPVPTDRPLDKLTEGAPDQTAPLLSVAADEVIDKTLDESHSQVSGAITQGDLSPDTSDTPVDKHTETAASNENQSSETHDGIRDQGNDIQNRTMETNVDIVGEKPLQDMPGEEDVSPSGVVKRDNNDVESNVQVESGNTSKTTMGRRPFQRGRSKKQLRKERGKNLGKKGP